MMVHALGAALITQPWATLWAGYGGPSYAGQLRLGPWWAILSMSLILYLQVMELQYVGAHQQAALVTHALANYRDTKPCQTIH